LTFNPVLSALFLAAGLLLGHAGAALATPTAAQQAAIRSACPDDFRSHCAGVSPGGAAALQCLEKNVAKLSSACQGAVKAVMPGASSSPSPDSPATTDSAATSGSSEATTPDPDAAATEQTQPENQKKSTSEPATAEPTVQLTLRQEIFLVREACGPEFRAYCGDVRLGGGNALACLRAHSNKLSGACKGAIADLMR
jgi:hypothetical protein